MLVDRDLEAIHELAFDAVDLEEQGVGEVGDLRNTQIGIGTEVERLLTSGAILETLSVGPAPVNRGDGSGFVYANSVDPDGDMDLDGYQDLLLANGHIEPEINSVQRDITFEQPPQLFRNDGTGRMVDISSAVGPPFTEPIVGRGLATSDIDRDGDLDILLTVNGGAPKLLRNDLPLGTAGWVRLRLEGKFPNVGAIGAALVLYSGVGVQREIIRTGSSYLGQSELSTIVFGLGTNTQVDSLTVRWPTTGTVSKFGSIAAGREYVITEGEPTSIATLQPPS